MTDALYVPPDFIASSSSVSKKDTNTINHTWVFTE